MIKVYNRTTEKYEIEKVAGEKFLNMLYSSPAGKGPLELFIKKKAFSRVYGAYNDSFLSKRSIPKFVNSFDIDMDQSVKQLKEFKSFNDFFTRNLVETARPISKNNSDFISLGDGRLIAYTNIDMNNLVQVKGLTYSLKDLIKNDTIANKYAGGICLILRLNPTDYHRFHFIDSGVCSETTKIKGHYYSVNPIALEKIQRLFCENKREWSIFKSDNFGELLYVEVGATCVGSIIQSYKPNKPVARGDEKGYFKFGGSTVILFIEKDKLKLDDDILAQSSLGIETKVSLGETIGCKIQNYNV
ncbi:phosphatidylserine decarboxylase [Clostridium cellulovorans]|uniref:Phosphatidylserine decarboxylase proenzyme n=1 Tax=Clostridium cellulovorans (strain ATCC 35296 / DSM 3052 / OCM 3 / 743B) TaxID=573061 RepID=D9SMP7_CLOC7|nr:phosphatidylserine decarboxylase [Clostridium cellulovorans]ADL49832.1 phosphatidylserine decarboxylase [Clostridium cellulovorans 743B]